MNKITSVIINGERRESHGTNLYNIVVDGCRSLESVLCRANGLVQKDHLNFQVKFENGSTLPFMATFLPDEDWVRLVDIIPCSDAGNMYL